MTWQNYEAIMQYYRPMTVALLSALHAMREVLTRYLTEETETEDENGLDALVANVSFLLRFLK